MSNMTTAAISEIHLETHIEDSPDRVWQALTDDIGAWWPAEFYAGGEPDSRSYHLEAEPGGRMYEQWADGGLLWGTVSTVAPGTRLQIVGATFPDWGGPSMSFSTWELEADDEGTVLRFSLSTMGRISEADAAEKEKGWRFLLAGTLKAYVEGTPPPQWED